MALEAFRLLSCLWASARLTTGIAPLPVQNRELSPVAFAVSRVRAVEHGHEGFGSVLRNLDRGAVSIPPCGTLEGARRPSRRVSQEIERGRPQAVIGLDTPRIVLAHLVSRHRPANAPAGKLGVRPKMECELWTGLHARGFCGAHGGVGRFSTGQGHGSCPSSVGGGCRRSRRGCGARTGCPLRSSRSFLRNRAQSVVLPSCDRRMIATARALGMTAPDFEDE